MELNHEQREDLSYLTQELLALANKTNRTKQDVQRETALMSSMASIKAGASLRDINIDKANELLRKEGRPAIKRSRLTLEQQYRARAWQYLVKEHRTDSGMTEGAPMLAQIGTYSGLGFFVPTDFYPSLYSAMAAHDVLFDEDSCTVITTENGRAMPVPVLGDIENVASVVSEAGSRSIVSISTTGHATLGVYTYDSTRWDVSIEAVQDLSGAFAIGNLARTVFSSRLARGISADLLTGNGTGKPLGLLTALSNIGVTPVTAVGSAGNTGGAETGANSIGSDDFANLVADLDSAYLDSPKTAFILNRKTLGYVNSIKDKQGHPAGIVQYVDGQPLILGIPVKISPSMPDISASATPVVLGDFSYWATRLVTMDGDNFGIKVYREADGLIEKGNVGLAVFARAGGALLYEDTGSPAPFAVLRCHS